MRVESDIILVSNIFLFIQIEYGQSRKRRLKLVLALSRKLGQCHKIDLDLENTTGRSMPRKQLGVVCNNFQILEISMMKRAPPANVPIKVDRHRLFACVWHRPQGIVKF